MPIPKSPTVALASANVNVDAAKDPNTTTKAVKPQVVKDRVKLLEGLSAAQAETLEALNKQMKGKSGAELKMLQKLAAIVKIVMNNYIDQIDLEQQKKAQSQESLRNPRIVEEKKRAPAEALPSLEDVLRSIMQKIENSYKQLGFECESSLRKEGKSFSISVEPKMPEAFKGQDPLKLSAGDLNKAREALAHERSTSPGTSPKPTFARIGQKEGQEIQAGSQGMSLS